MSYLLIVLFYLLHSKSCWLSMVLCCFLSFIFQILLTQVRNILAGNLCFHFVSHTVLTPVCDCLWLPASMLLCPAKPVVLGDSNTTGGTYIPPLSWFGSSVRNSLKDVMCLYRSIILVIFFIKKHKKLKAFFLVFLFFL